VTQADIGRLAPTDIAKRSVISSDESDAYDLLQATDGLRRVNYSREYSKYVDTIVRRWQEFTVAGVYRGAGDPAV
jgi:hypothetical protein